MKIQNKTELKRLLKHEGYDLIVFFKEGNWVSVGSGYGGEQGENKPVNSIERVSFYNKTIAEINAKIKEIELTC